MAGKRGSRAALTGKTLPTVLQSNDDVAMWVRLCRFPPGREKLSRNAIANAMGVSLATLQRWEERPTNAGPTQMMIRRAAHVCGITPPKFVAAHFLTCTPTRTQAVRCSLSPSRSAGTLAADTVADEIRNTGLLLSACGFTEGARPRNAQLFFERFGGLGGDYSLQTVGTRHGLTRERVRVIVDKQLSWRDRVSISTERFDALARACEEMGATTLSEAEDRLRPLLGGQQSLPGALEYGEAVLGRAVAIQEVQLPAIYEPLKLLTHRMVRHSGAAQITLAWALCMRETGFAMDLEEFRSMIDRLPGFEWVDDERTWFWLGHDVGANRILRRAMDVLQVAMRPLDIEVIYGGIMRRMKKGTGEIGEIAGVMPPIEVVLQMLRRCPAVECQQGDDFRLSDGNSDWDTDAASARDIVEYLRQHNGIATRTELRKELVEQRGMNIITLSVTLEQHPALQFVERGIWGIRGCPIDPVRLEYLREYLRDSMATSHSSSCPIEKLDGERIRWECAVSSAAVGNSRNKLLGIPASAIPYVRPGVYTCDGVELQVVIDDNRPRINGAMKHIRSLAPNDRRACVVRVTMSPVDRTIQFEIRQERSELMAVAYD